MTCERCDTQFQLDDERVPEGGARVRCSRCKHAFSVVRPARDEAERVHRAAAQALEIGETPEPSQDLGGSPADPADESPFGDPADDHAAGSGSVADDHAAGSGSVADDHAAGSGSVADDHAGGLGTAADDSSSPFGAPDTDWEFDEDSLLAPAGDGPGGIESAADSPPEASRPDGSIAAGSEAAEALGSPADWDIFDDPAPAPARAGVQPAPERREPAPSAPLRVETGLVTEGAAGAWARRAGGTLGWLAALALCGIGVHALATPAGPPAAALAVAPDGLVVEALDPRWVDNASLGRVLVVSGRLRNTRAAAIAPSALALEFRDGAGRALEKPIPLAAPRSPWLLRRGSWLQLRADSAPLGGPLVRDEVRAFEVVAWPLPPAAERFEIRGPAASRDAL